MACSAPSGVAAVVQQQQQQQLDILGFALDPRDLIPSLSIPV